MSKHSLDRRRETTGRVAQFTNIERREGHAGPHPATQELQRRAAEVGAPDDQRLEAFLRVERGKTA